MISGAGLIAVLANPNFAPAGSELRDVQEAAGSLGLKLHVLRAGDEPEIDNAFATMMRERADALLVAADPFFTSRRDQIVELEVVFAAKDSAACDSDKDGSPFSQRSDWRKTLQEPFFSRGLAPSGRDYRGCP
jgi:hypothetical protein